MKTSSKKFRNRRLASLFVAGILAILTIFSNQNFWQNPKNEAQISENFQQISQDLESLEVKGRAPKTGYSRKQFGDGWAKDSSGCDTRNRILKRDLRDTTENKKCQILTGILNDPYTGQEIQFSRAKNSSAVIASRPDRESACTTYSAPAAASRRHLVSASVNRSGISA